MWTLAGSPADRVHDVGEELVFLSTAMLCEGSAREMAGVF
jgi:hypothetical protein